MMASVLAKRFLTNRAAFRLNVARFNAPANVLLVKLSTNSCFARNDNQYLKFQNNPECNTAWIRKFASKPSTKTEKLTLMQRFKQMYKDYWYVLVPVHLVTSAAWFGGFYYAATSGVDIIGILESWNAADWMVRPLRDSSMGYVAVSYACYKIATPIRYTVTLGGTTISINYLEKWGYIKPKPIPSGEQIKEMYQEQKCNLMETVRETKITLKEQQKKLSDKKEQVVDEVEKSIKQMKDIGEQLKQTKKDVMKEIGAEEQKDNLMETMRESRETKITLEEQSKKLNDKKGICERLKPTKKDKR